MHNQLRTVFMVVVLLLLFASGLYQQDNNAKAANQLQINLHYHRYAKDYEGWNIWSWVKGAEGSSYEFTSEDDFGLVATYTLEIEDNTDQIGFIVRHSTSSNAWDKKDTENDRFIEVANAKEGVIDIFVIQEEAAFGYSKEEMNLVSKLLSASIGDSKSIDFSLTTELGSSAEDIIPKFQITDAMGNSYKIDSITMDEGKTATTGIVNMAMTLDLLKSYTLSIDGYGELPVSNVKVFSAKEFEDAYYYDGDDLGAIWTKEKTAFRVWAPTASEVILNLYEAGVGENLIESISMQEDVKGTWYVEKTGDLQGIYYTYSVTVNGATNEAVDPYARAVGVNGDRGMVIDLSSTDPTGFASETRPLFVNATDAVIYELHIRDFSMDENAGITHKGKYLAFTEKGTTTPSGQTTGIDYLKELGITHVHLLPCFDFASIDETTLVNNDYNWGYDPENYNVPEGSYSSNPQQGEVRINEYKQMVQALHANGIRVVMDVVYNHTASAADSSFIKIVPGYYYRMNEDGSFSNASGCGNETASERAMMRKFIIDSVVYWATEYHIDGFRFDLMGIHDQATMDAVREALDKVDPTILVYGEGWVAGSSTLPDSELTLKENIASVNSGIAAFSDDIRDGIKGSVFDAYDQGFVTGKPFMEDTIKFGVVASTEHEQIDYTLVNYSSSFWAKEPTQTITYASAHDNLTLWDKIASSNPTDSLEDRTKMNLLSAAIVFTSQGVPFFQAGEEFLRSKPADETGTEFVDNSYKSPDFVNSLRWESVPANIEVFNYYKGLIALRKAHPAFRMTTTKEIQNSLSFLEGLDSNVVGYLINQSPNGEAAKVICVIYNANPKATTVSIPEGEWNVYVKGDQAGTEILDTISGGKITVDAISAVVLVQEETKVVPTTTQTETANKSGNHRVLYYLIDGLILIVSVAIIYIIYRLRIAGK